MTDFEHQFWAPGLRSSLVGLTTSSPVRPPVSKVKSGNLGVSPDFEVRVCRMLFLVLSTENSEVKNRARARSVGIVCRNKARIFSHHFIPLA